MNIFRRIKINSLRKKKDRLLKESYLYSTKDRKKSDEFFVKATELENKIFELNNK
jgi:hypothetical protein